LIGKIVVHGGAGFWKKQIPQGLAGVTAAASRGAEILSHDGSALDAVEAAVMMMEDNPIFNAGKGSSLSVDGRIEMDAGIMDGRDLSAGAVALVRKVKNPIRLARIVMEKTDHVLLAGEDAERLAKVFALPRNNPMIEYRRKLLVKAKKGGTDERISWVKKNRELIAAHPEILRFDTVGALALDADGNYAAAASTGGPTMKLPGRIGDTPQIGSGLYADNQVGAATVTGLGEVAIRLTLSKAVCSDMERGFTARMAAKRAVKLASRRLRGEAGVIAIDKAGRIASVHNTSCMPWATCDTRGRRPRAWAHGEIVALVRKSA
jgi:beta-aspartyl-peptidase (threonine type)